MEKGKSFEIWSVKRRSRPEMAFVALQAVTGDMDECDWQDDALCMQTDPEAFYPEKSHSARDAKKVCGACSVREQCLEAALANDEQYGVWGGLSETERRGLRKRAS